MPMKVAISEEDRVEVVSEHEAESLVELGLLYRCYDCRNTYHHEEYERWEEVEVALATLRAFVSLQK